MAHTTPFTVLCIASYFKGVDFLRECKRRGCRVFLLTSRKLDQEPWPWESIDEVFYMDAPDEDWDMRHLIAGVSHLARKEQIDRIVPLDDFDLEKAAALREHLRIPGMGDTRTRYFRDKLAMRGRAQEAGLPVPDFVHLLNEQRIREFMERVPPPWIIKPRSQASAVGITKAHSPEEVWNTMDKLGDRFSHYLMEKFLPGDVFHVDSVVYERRVVFARAHRYMTPPWSVTHEGGIFRTHTLEYGSSEEQELLRLNDQLITAFGLLRGVSHTEFIRSDEDGQFYFLETSARVGGAHIAEMVEASSGINLWAEWARLETLVPDESYTVPEVRRDHAGLIISLARQEHPDTSAYTDPEIVWRLNKRHHVGLIVASPGLSRVLELLQEYAGRFEQDFFARMPAPDKPTS